MAARQQQSAMSLADRVVSWFSPEAALRRVQARRVLGYYEAAKPDRLRKGRRETGGPNEAGQRAGMTLVQLARHLEQNYDLARGVLNTLVTNTVGANGIGVEPQPRRADGTIDDALARELMRLWQNWGEVPEVTRQHDWESCQRMAARTWFRDGEVFAQLLAGTVPGLDHSTKVPFSLELLEPDYVPVTMMATSPQMVVQGVGLNTWGAPTVYHVLKVVQDGLTVGYSQTTAQTKQIGAANMLHVKAVDRIRQVRGVSVFASVLNRFDDLKDYEESERIAAKIAASMAAFIKKGNGDLYNPDDADGQPRNMKFRPGMVFDDLRPGEEIGMIDTNRPNPNLETYRSGQMKAIAAGTGPTYSSIARTYDGTYSSQRQELVEGYAAYAVLSDEFVGRFVRPTYKRFVAVAVASGVLRVPPGTQLDTLADAMYVPPQMPWIDPLKEAKAWGELEDRCYVSGPEVIRKRGGNPMDTLEQQARWLKVKDAQGIPANAAQPQVPEADAPEAQARVRLTEAQARLAQAQEAAETARTAHAEAVAAARVEVERQRLALVQAELAESAARRAAADANVHKFAAEAAWHAASTEAVQARAALDVAQAQASAEQRGVEVQAQLELLRAQAEQARQEADARAQAMAEAQAQARELHALATQEARHRARAAAVDVEAAESALAELRGGA